MAAYELLLLNTSIPQIQAAQTGDTYVCPRDIAFSAALTLSAGTANGVPYLNGSKVLTTGSALVFDGSNLGIGTSPNTKLNLYTVSGNNRIRVQSASQESYFGTDGTNTAIAWYGGDLTFGFSSNNGAITSEYMRLTSTGLGVGTNNPAYKVSAVVGSGADAFFADGNSQSYSGYRIRAGASGQQWAFRGGNTSMSLTDVTAGVDRVQIDSSGNLGLGVTPSAWYANDKALQVGTTTALYNNNAGSTGLGNNHYANTSGVDTYITSNFASVYFQTSGQHRWYTAPSGTAGNAISFTQAMTLDASGYLLVGTTSFGAAYNGGIGIGPNAIGTNVSAILVGHVTGAASGDQYMIFGYGGGSIGSITQNGTTGVLYNITSDYRLKDVVGAVTGAGARIDALKPVDYTWKADGSSARGFLAHEFQAVYPNSVTGAKDAVDEEGKPIHQQMQASTSEVIADLVAELQSLRARVAQLEGK